MKKLLSTRTNPGQKLIYKLETTFRSDNWSKLPFLIQRLKNSSEAQRAYARLGGGWTRTLLNTIGYARFQYQLEEKALKRDPLDLGLKASKAQALMSFASIDRANSAINKIESEIISSHRVQSARYFMYLMGGKIEKADSLAQTIYPSTIHPQNIFLQAVQGKKELARKNFARFPQEGFKNSMSSSIAQYTIGNIKGANELALAIDTTTLGPQKLLTLITDYGGLIGFDVAAMQNLSKRFQEAGVEVAPL